MSRYTASLAISTGKDSYSTSIAKDFNEYTKIEKEFDSVDTFNNLVAFEWNGISDNFRDCKGILICNTGETAAELQFVMEEWTAGACDSNAADSYNNTFLAVGESLYLPHNRIVGYNSATSAGGGTTNLLAGSEAHNTGFLAQTMLVNMGGGTTTGDASGAGGGDAITVDTASALKYHPGDYLMLSTSVNTTATEIIKIVTIDSATQITAKRGQLGTVPVNHADSAQFQYSQGNSYINISQIKGTTLAFVASGAAGTPDTITDSGNGFVDAGFKTGDIIRIEDDGGANDGSLQQIVRVAPGTLTLHSNCTLGAVSAGTSYKICTVANHTNSEGKFHISHFFGQFRQATAEKEYQGLVPGSVAIQFHNPASLKVDLGNVNSQSKSGLAASTAYRFNLNIDGRADNLVITTDASNLRFSGKNGIIEKLQTAIDDAVVAGTYSSGVIASFTEGNLVITSKTAIGNVNGYLTDLKNSNFSRGSSQILLADSTTGSEAQLLGSGKFPGGGFTEVYPSIEPETLYRYNKRDSFPNSADMLIDRGNGTMVRAKGGTATINYDTGEVDMRDCPPNATFLVWGTGCSALSGVMRTDAASSNCIEKISARSLNPIANAKLTCIVLS